MVRNICIIHKGIHIFIDLIRTEFHEIPLAVAICEHQQHLNITNLERALPTFRCGETWTNNVRVCIYVCTVRLSRMLHFYSDIEFMKLPLNLVLSLTTNKPWTLVNRVQKYRCVSVYISAIYSRQ